MTARVRKLFVTVVAIVFITALLVVGVPYAKFGAVNPAWAQSYNTLTNASVQFSLDLSIPFGNFVGGVQLTGFNFYTIDTTAVFGTSCANIVVYRLTEFGDLIRHKEVSCNGNLLTIFSVGTGTYFFAISPNPALIQNDVLLSKNP